MIINWLYVGIGVGVFIASLFLEITREWYEELWDYLTEGFEFVFSGDVFSDGWDFISSAFEGIGDFSIMGLTFGLIAVGTVYFASPWMLKPFLQYQSPFGKILWGAVTYIGCFIAGYLLGKGFENTG